MRGTFRGTSISRINVSWRRTWPDGEARRRAPPKRGPALLAGLLRCGRCGRKLFVAYSGRGGRVPRYACAGSRTGQDPTTCLSLGGVTIEQAVTDQVLEALQPVGIEASLTAVDQLDHTHTEQRRALELALEKARYQAQRAERQYHTVDPDNRLVAGELEVRWNDALVRVGQLEADLAAPRRHADGLDPLSNGSTSLSSATTSRRCGTILTPRPT